MTLNVAQSRVHRILEVAKEGDTTSRIADIFIMGLIVLNVIAVMLETVDSLSSQCGPLFRAFETGSVVIFSLEYLLRIWSCTVSERFKGTVKGRVRFALTPFAIIDALAILPFYLPMLIPIDLRLLRLFRLFRVLRLLKIGRYSDSVRIFGIAFRESKGELTIISFVLVILVVMVSSGMYYAEHDAQPELFASIPSAMWWGVMTLTTVGYGDVYPVTPLGKALGTFVAVLGIGMFAIPAAILSSAFVDALREIKGNRRKCPHCGKAL